MKNLTVSEKGLEKKLYTVTKKWNESSIYFQKTPTIVLIEEASEIDLIAEIASELP